MLSPLKVSVVLQTLFCGAALAMGTRSEGSAVQNKEVACEWEPWSIGTNCLINKEKDRKRGECIYPASLRYIIDHGTNEDNEVLVSNYKIVFNLLLDLVRNPEKIYEKFTSQILVNLAKLKLLGCLIDNGKNIAYRNEHKCKDDQPRTIQALLQQDIAQIRDFTHAEKYRYAVLPNFAGLLGGLSCIMENGLSLTYENWSDLTKFRGMIDHQLKPHECQYCLCADVPSQPPQPPHEGNITTTTPSPGPIYNCTVGYYRGWGDWSDCDAKCGTKQVRKRYRECRPQSACEVNGKIILKNCGVAIDGKKEVDALECPVCPGSGGGWGSWLPWTTTCVDNIQTMKRKRNCYFQKKKFRYCLNVVNGQYVGLIDEEESEPILTKVSPETCNAINRKG